MSLCIGVNVRIQSTKPYTIPSKTVTDIVTTVKNVKTETTMERPFLLEHHLGSEEKRF